MRTDQSHQPYVTPTPPTEVERRVITWQIHEVEDLLATLAPASRPWCALVAALEAMEVRRDGITTTLWT